MLIKPISDKMKTDIMYALSSVTALPCTLCCAVKALNSILNHMTERFKYIFVQLHVALTKKNVLIVWVDFLFLFSIQTFPVV